MLKSLSLILVLFSLGGISSCQSTHSVATSTAAIKQDATTPLEGATTEAEARASLARYIQKLPNAAVYQLTLATATDVETKWQIMVPRTDWANVMPNAAAFEVDKHNAAVTVLRVR